jgi:hypothetical protein
MSGSDPADLTSQGLVSLTEEQRRVARAMAGLGVSRRHIAMHLRIDEAMLMGQLGAELELAEVEANSKVAKALFGMATQKGNVEAAIFWMKARGGWREKQEIEATVNGEVKQRYVITVPARCDSAEQWLTRYAPGSTA